MLDLWLSPDHRKEDWYIGINLRELAKLFSRVRFPSTTTRIPRSLLDYHRFKANEMRALLLFGHVIFEKFLKRKYYDHLQQLVAIMHLAEGRAISKVDEEMINLLCRSFVVTFPQLYTPRHCIQVVHSILHIPETVHDFGPVTNYTTFHFENDLGKFAPTESNSSFLSQIVSLQGIMVRSTKGSRNQAQEIIENLNVLQHATRKSMDPMMNEEFSAFLLQLGNIRSTDRVEKGRLVLKHKCEHPDPHIQLLFPNHDVQGYNVLFIDHVRLSTFAYSKGKTTDDSNILFRLNGDERFGRICSIFTMFGEQPTLFVAHLTDGSPLVCRLYDQRNIECSFIQTSPTTNWSYVCVEIHDFIEKTSFYESDERHSRFCRFPNLTHSS